MRRRRIERDIALLLESSHYICNTDKDSVTVIVDGPRETPYEDGRFRLRLHFPDSYPFVPPQVRFLTRVYHPNISRDGHVCVDTLKETWSPALSAPAVVITVAQLMSTPNPDDPLLEEAAELMSRDVQAFDETARMWTHKYAR